MKNIAITPPEWFARSSIYQINPRTFSKEGTIAAVTKQLYNLAELGFGVMYLCPVFKEDDDEDRAFWSNRQKKSQTNNPKNPYRMNDYFEIDCEYGTAEDLKEFVKESHRLGLKVILDLVYYHIGPNADILKNHPEFVKQDADGKPLCGEWLFPLLDYNCQGLREYLWCNMVYYISVFDVDGFRCDVGHLVPLDFWVEGRRRIRVVKPDAVMLLEGISSGYLKTGFDATYCFDWHEKLYSIFTGDLSADKLRESYTDLAANSPIGMTVMRDIDNHDTATDWPCRTEIAAGHDGMEQIEVINYLIDGIPMVYCGNELADTARHSMFANRFFMGDFEVSDRALLNGEESIRRQDIIKRLNLLKRESDILRYGDTVWLDNTAPEKVISFMRTYGDGKIVFIGNAKNEETVCRVDTDFGISDFKVMLTSRKKAEISDDGKITLPPRGFAVLGFGG